MKSAKSKPSPKPESSGWATPDTRRLGVQKAR
jgi:hypothetical protein